ILRFLGLGILGLLLPVSAQALAEQGQQPLDQPASVNESAQPATAQPKRGKDLWSSQFPADAPKNDDAAEDEADDSDTLGGSCDCSGTNCCDYFYGVGYSLGPDDINPFAEGYGFYYDPNTRWALRDAIDPCSPLLFGGWTSIGYHSKNTRLSFKPNDLKAYNDLPDQLNLHQQWLFLAKEADGSNGLDWGFRADTVYGTDAQSLQATGNRGADTPGYGSWDASLDHGSYGWAMPQAYGELALGDWSVIGGRFLTLIGYDSSLAPENFFYSHSLTMFNSEPFTHTGVLANYNGFEHATVYGGWTLGWDTAFQQNLDGNAFLGGFSYEITDDILFSYYTSAGDFGYEGDKGYSHGIVTQVRLTDALKYVAQSDYRTTENSLGTPGMDIEEYGFAQYLLYRINEYVGAGTRLEWWNSDRLTPDGQSYYELTTGLNIRPATNVVIRPEIRYDWTPGEDQFRASNGENYNQWVFGVDCILTY
ncbi:MAG: porin, partial [Pirellulales bacterium]|nr:porin [Pirellulales bacterium]